LKLNNQLRKNCIYTGIFIIVIIILFFSLGKNYSENYYKLTSAPTQNRTNSQEPSRYQKYLLISTLSSQFNVIEKSTISPKQLFLYLPTSTKAQVNNNPNLLKIHFIDVGQGESILIESPEGKIVLIDGGNQDGMALAYLEKLGVKKIDLIIATHPHSDHIGGLIEILNSIPASKVITNGQLNTSSSYEQFLDAILNSKAFYKEVAQGDTISEGDLVFSVLNPKTIMVDEENENSIVLRLSFGKISFLFMGDAGETVEYRTLMEELPISSTILKLGHHGSQSSSSIPFLQSVKPEITIYSAGLGNPFGNPNPNVIQSLVEMGINIYGTDRNGTIIITSDGLRYAVKTEKSPLPITIP
jgi:competence protein ComEC